MAGHAYAQVRMLRLKDAQLATIFSAAYKDLKLHGFAKKAEAYVQDADMWEATFVLQRCLFPMICVLRLGDKSACGGMSKIMYFVHKTDKAIRNSMKLLPDLKYFRLSSPSDANDEDSVKEDKEMDKGMEDGMESDNEAVLDAEEDSDAEEVDTNMVVWQYLGEQILDVWNMRRQKLIAPLLGQDWMAIDGVLAKIFYPIQREDLAKKIQAFWKEFKDFQTRRGPVYIGLSDPFLAKQQVEAEPHVWHKIYTEPYTRVFGYVACRVALKPLGCGGAEQTWGAFKHFKNRKRLHMSAEKLQWQTTVYGLSSIERSRAMHAMDERQGLVLESHWSDADIAYHAGVLDAWSLPAPVAAVVVAPVVAGVFLVPPVVVAPLKVLAPVVVAWVVVAPVEAAPVVPPVAVRKRLFKAWIEDWEWACWERKDDPEAITHLLLKYHGLH
jgi:hypothetical protein